MTRRPMQLALTALIVCAALTGCSGAGATPGSTPAGDSTPSAIETPAPAEPTPTAPAEDPADPATWIISGAGIGPLQRGEGFDASAPGAGPYTVAASGCPNPSATFLEGDGLANLSIVTEDDGSAIAVAQVTSWGTSGDIVSPSTAAGVRLGATVAELEEAYPGIEQTGTSNNSLLFGVEDSGGWIVFWLGGESVVQISAAPTPEAPTELCG
ncbi:hypothetical protein ACWEOH_01655 [Agromyces sp. NPDC004153]